jgi:Flp pilus assembly protein TadG
MNHAMHRLPSDRSRQSGLAAVEFSFVITIFIILLTGVIGFGALFWTQQRLAETASEGARAAIHARAEGKIQDGDLKTYACKSAIALFDGGLDCDVKTANCPWSPPSGGMTYTCASVSLTYNVATWAPVAGLQALVSLLPSQEGGSGWIPDKLHANADVQIWQNAP